MKNYHLTWIEASLQDLKPSLLPSLGKQITSLLTYFNFLNIMKLKGLLWMILLSNSLKYYQSISVGAADSYSGWDWYPYLNLWLFLRVQSVASSCGQPPSCCPLIHDTFWWVRWSARIDLQLSFSAPPFSPPPASSFTNRIFWIRKGGFQLLSDTHS